MNWINLAQDEEKWLGVVNTVMSLCVPYNAENFSTSYGTTGFTKMTVMHGPSKQYTYMTVNNEKLLLTANNGLYPTFRMGKV